MKLSIIIPTRSRYNNLIYTLNALENQTLPRQEYEIIVVDDNSQDETQTIINEHRDKGPFKYIFSSAPKPHTWNASVIRNMGALVASPETLAYVFVDSDVVLPPHALACYVEDLEMNKNRVIIGPYDFYREGNEQIAQEDVRSLKFEETRVDETFETVHDGLACFSGNICMPKKLFWNVGGYSEDIPIGLEDGEMGIKLWKKGSNFSYDKRTRGKHQWHETPKDRFPADMRKWINYLNKKHFHTEDPDYGIIEVSREAYAKWGFENWEAPPEWKKDQINLGLKINND